MRASARERDETSKAKIRMSVGMLLACVYVQGDSAIAGGACSYLEPADTEQIEKEGRG